MRSLCRILDPWPTHPPLQFMRGRPGGLGEIAQVSRFGQVNRVFSSLATQFENHGWPFLSSCVFSNAGQKPVETLTWEKDFKKTWEHTYIPFLHRKEWIFQLYQVSGENGRKNSDLKKLIIEYQVSNLWLLLSKSWSWSSSPFDASF